jgi:hypothetical protein
MRRAADRAALYTEASAFWLLSDYADAKYAGRSATVVFTAEATASEAADQIRALAAELAENGLAGGSPVATPIGDETEFRKDSFITRLGPRLTPELAELLLRLAVNQVRRVGLPKREEWLVMTDPFEVE